MTKRVVAIADLHCGHRVGLTPPNWRGRKPEHDKYAAIQDEAWRLYAGLVKKLRPVDCLIVNGDCIDGRGERSGGVELITGDRNEQCQMASECIWLWKPGAVVMVRGTPYHTGEIEAWEDQIATSVGAKIGDHEWVDVNGFIFDVKHFIGASQIPHGRATALRREELWNAIWAEADMQPRADMILRAHVHYCDGTYSWATGKRREGVILPALQAMGTRFGARQCSGIVNWGLLGWDIDEKGQICQRHECVITLQKQRARAFRV